MGALKPSAGAGRVGDRELAENAGKSGIDDRSEAGDGGGLRADPPIKEAILAAIDRTMQTGVSSF